MNDKRTLCGLKWDWQQPWKQFWQNEQRARLDSNWDTQGMSAPTERIRQFF